MAKKRQKDQRERKPELEEHELEEQDGEPLPDREALALLTPPFASSPHVTLPVEPTE